jgi:hypothetical protein
MSFANGGRIVTDGLVLSLDASDRNSYLGSGTSWTDLSGNGNHYTLVNSPTFSNNAIVFDGISQYAFGPSFYFDANTSFTMEIFYSKLGQVGDGKAIAGQTQQSSGSINSNARIIFGLFDPTYGVRNNIYDYTSGLGNFIDNVVTNDLNNHQLVMVADKINKVHWSYSDGEKTIRLMSSPSYPTGDVINGPNPIYLGCRAIGNAHCNVRIFSVKLYNRALSSTEVLQNYNASKSRFNLA